VAKSTQNLLKENQRANVAAAAIRLSRDSATACWVQVKTMCGKIIPLCSAKYKRDGLILFYFIFGTI
jgi:hypothetical protein